MSFERARRAESTPSKSASGLVYGPRYMYTNIEKQ